MSTAFIALQDVDEARPLVEAAEKDNDGLQLEHHPAMVRMVRDKEIVIRRETVEEITGRDWEPQDIHLVLISVGGNIDEGDDYFRVYWNN
ncbi:MAG TPA: monooxygenase [Thermopetrobacter sp.]|nr:monooxygenase [Thermopetrobacter sp.]